MEGMYIADGVLVFDANRVGGIHFEIQDPDNTKRVICLHLTKIEQERLTKWLNERK